MFYLPLGGCSTKSYFIRDFTSHSRCFRCKIWCFSSHNTEQIVPGSVCDQGSDCCSLHIHMLCSTSHDILSFLFLIFVASMCLGVKMFKIICGLHECLLKQTQQCCKKGLQPWPRVCMETYFSLHTCYLQVMLWFFFWACLRERKTFFPYTRTSLSDVVGIASCSYNSIIFTELMWLVAAEQSLSCASANWCFRLTELKNCYFWSCSVDFWSQLQV